MIKFVKSIGAAIIVGAGMELGTILARKGAQIMGDPAKKAAIKRKFNKIKDAIFKKEEES